jgi:membrane protein implicated in regulation of membrane protease activity
MAAVVIWLIVAGVLAVGEILTLALVFGMFAVGAGAAAVVALLGGPTAAQVVTCIGVSALVTAGLRPVARRHLNEAPRLLTGTQALIGARGTVLEPVDENGGRIKIGGEVWSARTYAEDEALDPGTPVRVLTIEGATAVVHSASRDLV